MVTRRLRGFLGRFVHPRLAAVALVGVGLVVVASLVALVGVAMMNLAAGATGPALVGLSALISLLGILVLVACGGYLLALWLLRDVLGVVG